jgi:hypothetical protein
MHALPVLPLDAAALIPAIAAFAALVARDARGHGGRLAA